MASKTRSYYEPWSATRSSTWNLDFLFGEPKITDPDDPEQSQALVEWNARKASAEKNAPWLIWGSDISPPAICAGLTGQATFADDKGIITVQKSAVWPDRALTQELMAKRIAACVSACAGIADPEKFVNDVRSLLLSYCQGEAIDPRDDSKVISLLGRCAPPEETEQFNAC